MHLTCSGLPQVCLIRLATTRATYLCRQCTERKAGDKLDDVLDERKRIMELETELLPTSDRDSDPSLSDDSEQSQTADHSSAPPASQVQLSADVVVGAGGGSSEDWGAPVSAGSGKTVSNAAQGPAVATNQSSRRGQRESSQDFLTNSRRSKNDQRNGNRPPKLSRTADNKSQGGMGYTDVCRYYKNGTCKYGSRGDGCKRSHPRKCHQYLRFGSRGEKSCNGKECAFYHPPLCRELEAGNACSRKKCRFFHRSVALTAVRKATNAKTRVDNHYTSTLARHRDTRAGARPEISVFEGELTPRTQREVNNHLTDGRVEGSHGEWAAGFQILQSQLHRMERQVQHLLDVRVNSDRGQTGVWNTPRDHDFPWGRFRD